jgi:glycosyltransferase involved in cell wall biosynthesis
MDNPRVSVVICTYNQASIVDKTIESVLAQTYPNLEIIVTDDGSTDDTPNILKAYQAHYPDRIKLVLSQVNTGIPSNINRGMALRSGELIAWLDGDDLMLPQKIERQTAFLLSHPEATGCYHDAEVFESETGRVLGKFSEIYNGTSKQKQGRLKDWLVPRYFAISSTIMCHSETCPAHGYDVRLRYCSDTVFFAETFRTGLLLAMPDILSRYRRHEHNVTGSSTVRNVIHEYDLMALSILEARYPEQYAVWRKLRRSSILTEALKCYREGNRQRFYTLLRNAASQGGLIQSAIVLLGTVLSGQQVANLTAAQISTRPSWIKRLSRYILEH